MAFGVDTEVPNTRVILRQPDVIVNRSLIPIQPVAEFALSASYAQSASYVFGSIESASYALFALTASYVSGAVSDWDTLANKPEGLVSSSTQIINYNLLATTGSNIFTGTQIAPSFSGSLFGTASWAQYAVTASYVEGPAGITDWSEITNKPDGLVSSSAQINTGSFSGSFIGDGSGLTNIASTLTFSGSTGGDVLNLKTETLNILGSNGITTSITDNTVTVNLPAGTVTASSQIDYTQIQNQPTVIPSASYVEYSNVANKPTLVSASSQVDVTQTTNIATIATTGSNTFTGIQNISNTTNSTNYTDGALVVTGGVGIGKDVNISGSLNVIGLLTAISMSTQYVTSSQYTVGTSRIILNDDDLVRFAGISVIDSGSTYGTGSLLWDSLNNRWIYEADDLAYNSAILIAGPKNTGTLGNEVGLISGRIPVATGDDHIDTALASSSLYIDFADRKTYVEAGLYVTGSITASNNISGTLIGTSSWASNAVTASYVEFTNVANKPTLVSSSLQINTGSFSGSFTGELIGTSSWATNAVSSSVSLRSAIISTGSAPSNPITDELWYDDTTGKTYIYYVSASVGQWVLQSDPTYDPGPSLQNLQDVTDLGAITNNAITITNTTPSTSNTTGALIVSGGLGVSGSIYTTKVSATQISGSVVSASAYVGQKSSIIYVIDGGGLTIQTGVKGDLYIPFDCTVNEWVLLADQAGSIVIDVWSDVYGSYPPTGADTITGTDLPTLSSVNKNKSTALTGWNPNISAGNTLRFNVNSVTSITRVTLTLNVTKT